MAKFIANLHNDVVKGGIMSDEFLQDLTPFERLEQLDAEGLLTDGAIMDIFATNFGINSLTPQNIASITKAINSANQTNNPIARQTIINNMIAQINKNKNVSFTDYFKSTWFASVLSGTGTLDLNFAWGFVS